MSINLKQLPDGSAGLEGADAGAGPIITKTAQWTANSVNMLVFIAPRAMVVQSITARVETAGTDAGAVTAVIKKAASGTALTSGTALHSGTINLKGTAATNQVLTLATTASTLALNAGDCVGIQFTGTLTAAVGAVTIGLTPA
jgi:hypothetical protein